MTPNNQTSAAFTGYRLSKILRSTYYENSGVFLNEIAQRTFEAINFLVERGCTNFYNGGSSGYDLLAAEQVIRAKETNSNIKLIIVAPFKGQESRYDASDKRLYARILEQADETIFLAEHYTENSQFLRRNDYMLERVSNLICYYNGERGGTMYTFNRAKKAGMQIINTFKEGEVKVYPPHERGAERPVKESWVDSLKSLFK